jgi:hypothetical protein
MKALWTDIEAWLEQHAPGIAPTLAPPASAAAVAAVESELGVIFPNSVRESYLVHDGGTEHHLAIVDGLELPRESLSPNRFDETTREFVTTAAHYVVKEIHDRDIHVLEARPKAEGLAPDQDPSAFPNEPKEDESLKFTTEQIQRTNRLARDHGFDGFDSGRAANASYEDT